MRYDWPGNVRELQNVVHRAMLSCERDEITLGDLPADLRAATRSPSVRMPLPVSQRVPLMSPAENDARLPTIQLPPLDSTPPPPPPIEAARAEAVAVALPEVPAPISATLSMAEVEAAAIQRALRMTNGNVSLAARLLKIGRATLYRRITELSLDVATLRTDRG